MTALEVDAPGKAGPARSAACPGALAMCLGGQPLAPVPAGTEGSEPEGRQRGRSLVLTQTVLSPNWL